MRLFTLAFAATALISSAVSAQTIERLKETNHLTFGYRTDAAPLSYQTTDGNPAGYSPAICNEIAQYIANTFEMKNLDVDFVAVDSKDRFDKVANGEIDLLCGAATITLSRREKVDFSIPTYVDGTSVLLPKSATGHLSDLAGKKIGMRSATTTEQAVLNSFGAASVEADMVRFNTHPDGFKALQNGEIDAYFADQSILLVNYFERDMVNDFKLMDEILTIEKHGFALAKGDSDFRLLIDSALSELYAAGTMQKLFQAVLPGATPGAGLQAMYVIAPTLP